MARGLSAAMMLALTLGATAVAPSLQATAAPALTASVQDTPPAADLAGKSKKKIKVRLRAPRQVYSGERFTLRATTKNARKGQKVQIMTRAVGAASWTVVKKTKLNRRGTATAGTVFRSAGRFQARAVVKKGKGRKGGVSTQRLIRSADRTYQVSGGAADGPLLTGAPDGYRERSGREYWWHPDTGWFGLDAILAAAEVAEPRVDDISSSNFRVTGGAENTRILAFGSYYTPSAGLEPAFTTHVIFVYDPFADTITKMITARDKGWREFFGGDGDVFLTQQDYYNDTETVIAYNAVTGAEVWRRPGHVEFIGSGFGETKGVGTRSTAVIDRFYNISNPQPTACRISTMVTIETGAAWTLDHLYNYDADPRANRCGYDVYRQNLVSLQRDLYGSIASDPVFDLATGTRLNIPGTAFLDNVEHDSGLARSKEGGLVAWTEESGEVRVTRNDGTLVWSLPAEKAAPVNARVLALAPTTLWLRTSDQMLRVDLVTGAVEVTTEEPTFPVTQLRGGWTLYTDGLLRRDRL